MPRSLGTLLAVGLFTLSADMVSGQQGAASGTGQTQLDPFSSKAWCQDALTICFSDASRERRTISGIRLVFEPNLGVIFQNGANRFQNTSFKALERIGLETNLHTSFIAVQALLIYPSFVEFDDKSPITAFIRNDAGKVGVDYGLSLGLSFVHGILAVGAGYLNYDQRDLTDADSNGQPRPKKYATDTYFYFNVQPVSAVRSALRR